MKTLIASIVILGLAVAIVGVTVVAAPEANVSATVTVQQISVSVSPTSVNYGTLPFNGSKSSVDVGVTFIATNGSNIPINFNVRGINTTGVVWTLVATPGTNQFRHTVTGTNPPITEQNLTTSSASWATSVAVAGTQVFTSKFYTPTDGNGTGQTASTAITIIATL